MGCVSAKSKKPNTTGSSVAEQKFNTEPDNSTNKLAAAGVNPNVPPKSLQQQQQQQQTTTNSAAAIPQKEKEIVPSAAAEKSLDTSQKQSVTQQQDVSANNIPKIPANPRSIIGASQQQQSFQITPSAPTVYQLQQQQVSKIVDPAIVDPSSLKGIAQSLQIQQMRLSKTDKQASSQIQNSNNFEVNDEESRIRLQQESQLSQQHHQYIQPSAVQYQDRVLNKHILSILGSLNQQQSSKTCYSTPPVPTIQNHNTMSSSSEWMQVETFGVYGNSGQNMNASQNDDGANNFMND